MTTFTTTVETTHARKYLQQLCKHFAHKVSVDFSPEEGRVLFPPGRCLMNADESALTFYCKACDDGGIPVIKSILEEHLVKFAWREELDYAWTSPAPDDAARILQDPDFLSTGTEFLGQGIE